jgi:hypothetical protein
MLIIAETKLENTLINSQFAVDNYNLWRADRNSRGGGLLVYIRSELACDRKSNLDCGTIESIFTEINFKNRKWLICELYRPPSLSDHLCMEDLNKIFDNSSVKYDNVILNSDLNNNVLDEDKGTPLTTMCDIFDYTKLAKQLLVIHKMQTQH